MMSIAHQAMGATNRSSLSKNKISDQSPMPMGRPRGMSVGTPAAAPAGRMGLTTETSKNTFGAAVNAAVSGFSAGQVSPN